MAFSCSSLALALFLSSFLLIIINAALAADFVCEELPDDLCAFSIASSGKRCLLETYQLWEGHVVEYQCRTSEVVVEMMSGYVENDDCVDACGVDRSSVGISSDAFLEPQFTKKLCSRDCHGNCPNIIDLYFNLAAGEGVSLSELCHAQHMNPQHAMIELLSSSGAALSPLPSESFSHLFSAFPVPAPAPAPLPPYKLRSIRS